MTRAVSSTGRARGRSTDARHILRWVVEAARALGDKPQLLRALSDLASFDVRMGRAAEARVGFTETLRLAGELGDTEAAALARHGLDALGDANREGA
jgi:hypothetical protein